MPSQEEINRTIDIIMTKGLNKQPAFQLKKLSVRNLVFGIEDCVLIAFLSYALTMVLFSVISVKGTPFVPLQFMISPLLFGILFYLSMWKDVMNKTIEWKQACRVNYKYLTVYRMILFGGASVIANVCFNLLLWEITGKNVSCLWILSFSFASLFLFGLLSLILLNRNIRHGIVFLSLVWIVFGLAMFLYEDIMKLTIIIPIYVLLLITIGSVIGLILQIKAFISSPAKGVFINAYN
jgi:hypothetical protein